MRPIVNRPDFSEEALAVPDQHFHASFRDKDAPGLVHRAIPNRARLLLLAGPLAFAALIGSLLLLHFYRDGSLVGPEAALVTLMFLLAGFEAMPSANAIIGFFATEKPQVKPPAHGLTVALLATIRDEDADEVISGKIKLVRALQNLQPHSFVLHVLSDSTAPARIAHERRLVSAASALPVFHHHRPLNVDFKSGNIRNWIINHGAPYDAFIILDADSELERPTALALANALASDPGCGLIQTVPVVRGGATRWQHMQSVASTLYGQLQGQGLCTWMGDEANYYGHNAIVRTKAFAASAGLPHLTGAGLWNGPILSHDFVEAALLRRAGWAVRLIPGVAGSFEQAPLDVVAHLKRDARWCLGNFQHSRILGAVGFKGISRFHLLSGIFAYLTSVLWLATLVLWALLPATRESSPAHLPAIVVALLVLNLMLPRGLGVIHALRVKPGNTWSVVKAALAETLFSSLLAPALMLQRTKIIVSVLSNQKPAWAPFEKSDRSLLDHGMFHGLEVLVGLGMLALVERGFLSPWFLPLAACLSATPFLSWFAASKPWPPHTKN